MFWDGRNKIMKKMQAMETDGWEVERHSSVDPKWYNLNWTVRKDDVLAVLYFTKQGKLKNIVGNRITKFHNVEYYHPFNKMNEAALRTVIEEYK